MGKVVWSLVCFLPLLTPKFQDQPTTMTFQEWQEQRAALFERQKQQRALALGHLPIPMNFRRAPEQYQNRLPTTSAVFVECDAKRACSKEKLVHDRA